MLIRYIQGVLSDEEEAYLMTWLGDDPDHEKILLHTAQIYYAQQTEQRMQSRNAKAAFDNVWRRLRKNNRRVLMQRFLAVAGCILLCVSVAFNGYYYHMEPDKQDVQYFTMQTNAGMRTHFTLPDGTEVFLNAGSQLRYPIPFDEKERKVELEGEGYFNVVPNQKQPFIVSALHRALEVEVLGTAFNIQAYDSDRLLTTTLVEGSIRLGVEMPGGVRKSVVLEPSQRAVYDVDAGDVRVSRVNTVYDTAWTQGKLMFRDTPLPEVLDRLSHFYNVDFQIENESVCHYTFTGTFENRQLSQILDYISVSSQIKYRIVPLQEDDSEGKKQTQVILTK